ncbi:DNA-binding response regulator [Planomonospora parontospora subsp. parontospora]|uniref:DNA-binding response regulator n=2 Tax=Planomonospora parontospora TaxID=58119 RepID=A0AA37F716_9ACTN|nr:DNA-binding response regulator [Planomonospora parontospora]GII10904.1 DNA-binding response regulator [Planomonospora parontospora subsp. parontospora]
MTPESPATSETREIPVAASGTPSGHGRAGVPASPGTPVPTGNPASPEASDRAVRVLVVDDQRLIREAVASLLGIQPGITVVGTAADGHDAVEQTVALAPDVVLMDVRMPGMGGVEAVAALRDRAPGVRVVMLTTFDDEEYVVQALRAGATGYLLKDVPARELAAAVRLAHAGIAQLDPAAAARLASVLAVRPGAGPDASLTARELDVLRLIARGSTNREIAERLFLSEGTVKNHISRILHRLGLRDRTQAAVYARDHGLG